MARPKIIKETRRPITEREPPGHAELSSHTWLSHESTLEFERALKLRQPFAMYLSSVAEKKIREHASSEAYRRLEVMGFLLGEVASLKGRVYIVVRDVVTTELKSSSSKVRFDPEAFPKLFAKLDESGFDYVLVGWYHSHPGHTCFLSRTDLETQKTMFDQPYHIALVIDPINEDVKAFRLVGEGYEEVPFAVFVPPKNGVKRVRTRRLKVTPVAPE
jgi:proteasome lid subunit RPN8/RPN11